MWFALGAILGIITKEVITLLKFGPGLSGIKKMRARAQQVAYFTVMWVQDPQYWMKVKIIKEWGEQRRSWNLMTRWQGL